MNVYNDCITEMVCGRGEEGEAESTGGSHSAVSQHCALTLYCYLPVSEYPFLLALRKEKGRQNRKTLQSKKVPSFSP